MPALVDRLRLISRTGACIAAGIPTTGLLPLPLSLLLTKRYQREEFIKNFHFMVQWARFCRSRLLKIDLQVEGKAHLPRPSRGHMYVSNHQSYVDILVLIEALESVAFLSKDMVRKIPVAGISAYGAGSIFLDRGDKESRQEALRKVIQMCKESTAVVVFPEGTRSQDGNLREKIYPNSMRAAFEEKLKVIPVGIDGTNEVVPRTMDALYLGKKVQVMIGPPMDPGDYSDAEAWVEAVWAKVGQLFNRCQTVVRQPPVKGRDV